MSIVIALAGIFLGLFIILGVPYMMAGKIAKAHQKHSLPTGNDSSA